MTTINATTFDALMSSLGPFEDGPHLAVAVSGGADSMALVLLADNWVRGQGGGVTALTVDHGLRRASEMESVCETLAELGLPSYMSQASGMTQKLVGDLNLSAQYPGGTPTDAEHLAGEILKRLGVAPANPL